MVISIMLLLIIFPIPLFLISERLGIAVHKYN